MSDKFKDAEIQGVDISLGEITNLHLSVKQVGGKMMVDCRKWIKYPNVDDYRPTHKGIMMSFEAWDLSLRKIMGMMNECGYKSTYVDNSLHKVGGRGGEGDGSSDES